MSNLRGGVEPMQRGAKIATWIVVGIGLVFALIVVPPLWRYTGWFLKVWSAKVSVNGKAAPNSRLYSGGSGQWAVVVKSPSPEYYFIGTTPKGSSFVWRCGDHAFSFLPGLAYSNHVQFGRGCIAGNFGVADQDGNPISSPKHHWNPALQIGTRSLAFIAEDGKRLRVAW